MLLGPDSERSAFTNFLKQSASKYSGRASMGSVDPGGGTGTYHAPPPPTASPPAGPGPTPAPPASTTPDYAGLINDDPIFQQLKKSLSAQGIADASHRAAAIQQALIDFGTVPDFGGLDKASLGYLGSDVNPLTRNLADQNTQQGLSITARLAKANADAQRNLVNQLAARGIYRSGELPHGLSEQNLNYKQATVDARKQLMDYITGAITAYTQSERERQAALAAGAGDAAGRAKDRQGATPPGTTADDVGAIQTAYGEAQALRDGSQAPPPAGVLPPQVILRLLGG